MKITGTEILHIGFKEGKQIGLALAAIGTFTDKTDEQLLNSLRAVFTNPQDFVERQPWIDLVDHLLAPEVNPEIPLRDTPLDYKIYGAEGIEDGALKQINTAMKLPVAVAGALMPDAHQG
ncbi:RtcB family protein, partial [Saprospiraceae bacterium]|nr:RtcB family protein [Saprospiraceae bacterium]